MHFNEWAALNCPEGWDNPLFLSVVTEGLSKSKHQLLMVVIAEYPKNAPGVIHLFGIPGGDASLTEKYTGLNRDTHSKYSLSIAELTKVNATIRDRVVVTYTANRFTIPFLDKLAEYTVNPPSLCASCILDVQTLWSFAFDPEGFPAGLSAAASRDYKTAGSMDKLFEESGLETEWGKALEADPVFIQKTKKLYGLYKLLGNS